MSSATTATQCHSIVANRTTWVSRETAIRPTGCHRRQTSELFWCHSIRLDPVEEIAPTISNRTAHPNERRSRASTTPRLQRATGDLQELGCFAFGEDLICISGLLAFHVFGSMSGARIKPQRPTSNRRMEKNIDLAPGSVSRLVSSDARLANSAMFSTGSSSNVISNRFSAEGTTPR
jgi:hypothetical protein